MGRLDLTTRRSVVVIQRFLRCRYSSSAERRKYWNFPIYCLLLKFRNTDSVYDLPRGTRKKLTVEHYCFIDEVLANDDDTMCTQLHNHLMKIFHKLVCLLQL